MDGVLGNHYTERDGCPACDRLAAIEREAVQQERERLRGVLVDWCSTGDPLVHSGVAIQCLRCRPYWLMLADPEDDR
jgi:hypothetical protein